ncbi:ArsR/SmtB family transcription factor [Umezawaea beigongshangensis]|uniref:ArsR/SmtB family transcription factor n=1 Tax=Umezawaea beigongshangensis TaxID=2780383 RepID=UPI0018F26BF0|nr:winged helix-turn-helix domain-containing protein [Umezawaea beigongshangensis]
MRGDALAELAALLADRTRAEICLALLDGRAWTPGELAAHARVAPSTVSEHLNRLVAGGLLVRRTQGRHRYAQFASPGAAQLVEDLAAHADPAAERPSTLRAATAATALARGRTCYDHLAGRLGVGLADALIARGLLDDTAGFALTPAGTAWFAQELAFAPGPSRRPVARACLDWTERRSHLAGQAGAHLRTCFAERGWITGSGTGRAVRVTPQGRAALCDLLSATW